MQLIDALMATSMGDRALRQTDGRLRIGHIALNKPVEGGLESLIALIDSLSRAGFQQYVLTGSPSLNRRLALNDGVRTGPVVRSAVGACCFMTDVDVVHAHDSLAGQAALMLRLTKSTPYLLEFSHCGGLESQITTMIMRRASSIVCHAAAPRDAVIAKVDDVPVVFIPELRYADAREARDRDWKSEDLVRDYVRLYRFAVDQLSYPDYLL